MLLVYELQILLPGGPAPSGVNIVLGELMLRYTSDIDTDFIGSRTQRIFIMLRHYLCPVGKLEFCVQAGPFAWIMLFFVRRLTFLRVGQIASLFGCLNVGVYLSCSQGFSLNCSLFSSTFVLGGGGIVTIEGFVLYAGGIMVYTLILCYTKIGTLNQTEHAVSPHCTQHTVFPPCDHK